jgi:hypothetical protein
VIRRLLAAISWLFGDSRDLRGLTEQEYEDWDYFEGLAENVGLSQRDQEYLDSLRAKRGIHVKSKEGTGRTPLHRGRDPES